MPTDNGTNLIKSWFQSPTTKQSLSGGKSLVSSWFSNNDSIDPLDDTIVARAQKDQGDQSYDNYCEQFVEQAAYGKAKLYPTAADAYQNYQQMGVAHDGDITNAPRGALVYFAPDASNSGEGHTGIADGKGGFVSATSNGVATLPINNWIKTTGQQPLGWVMPPSNFGGQQ